MRVLLVQAFLGRFEPPIFPVGLNALARYLVARTEHSVQVLDMNLYRRPYEALSEALLAGEPEVVGVSLRNVDTTQYRDRFYYFLELPRIVDAIKRWRRDVLVVVGGPGFSVYAREVMQRVPKIDIGVVGEGERAFAELLANPGRPEQVQGLLFRQGTELMGSSNCQLLDLAEYPDGVDYVVPVEPYSQVEFSVGVESKRGCAQRCVYCVYPFLNGSRIRARPPERIVDEVEMLVREKGVATFQFIDPVFNIPPSHAEAICSEMIRRGLGGDVRWIAWFAERFLTDRLWDLALEAGCAEFAFSPDAFSDRVLEKLGKASRQQDILATFRKALRNQNASVSYNFFISPPGERPSDFFKLLFFFIRSKLRLGARCRVFASYIRIEPHTRLEEIALQQGVLSPGQSTLPETAKELKSLFYINRSTRGLGRIFGLMYLAKRVARLVLQRRRDAR